MGDDERFRNAVIYGTSHPEMYMTPEQAEIERRRAENEKLRAERDNFYIEYRMVCDEECKIVHAENEKLRAALKPFAELAEYYDVEPDAQPAWDRDFQPTVGELRAAAAALKETE